MGIMSVVGVGIFAGVRGVVRHAAWRLAGRVSRHRDHRRRRAVPVAALPDAHGPLLRPDRRADLRAHQWRWAGGRTVRAISAVEDLFLKLARTDSRRLQMLVLLSIACYWLMAFEVFLVFWAIGQPISLWIGTIVETFTRSASVAGGAIPGNLGALEASNVAVVKALGLAGGGTLALFRRFRSLLFATLGLALYPRDSVTASCAASAGGEVVIIGDLSFDDPGVGQRPRRRRPLRHRAARLVVPVVPAGQRHPDHRPQHEVPGAHAVLRGMTTLGSLVGCFLLYGVARRGGEAFMRKRLKGRYVDRALRLYQKYGLLAVVVPALLPPPVPFKVFVLMAGAAAVSPWRFGAAVVIGRGIRYFGQGYLAVLYGERAADFMKEYGAQIGIGLAAAAVVAGGIVIWLRAQAQVAMDVLPF